MSDDLADALRQLVAADTAPEDARSQALAHARTVLAAHDAPRNRQPLMDPVASVLLERVRDAGPSANVVELADEVFAEHRRRLPIGTSAEDVMHAAANRARERAATR